MAENAPSFGLFGPSMDQYGQMQDQMAQQQALVQAAANPAQTALFGAARAGQRGGNVLGQLMGVQDPMIAKIQKVKAIEKEMMNSGIDITDDPVSFYKKTADLFRKAGLYEEAMMASAEAFKGRSALLEQQKKQKDIEYTGALTDQAGATAAATKQATKQGADKFQHEKTKLWPIEVKKAAADADKAVHDAKIAKSEAAWREELLKAELALRKAQREASLASKDSAEKPLKLEGEIVSRFLAMEEDADEQYEAGTITREEWSRRRNAILQSMANLFARPGIGQGLTQQMAPLTLPPAAGTPWTPGSVTKPQAGGGRSIDQLIEEAKKGK